MSLALAITIVLDSNAIARFTCKGAHSNNFIDNPGQDAFPTSLRRGGGDKIVRALVEKTTEGSDGSPFSMTKRRTYMGPGLVDSGAVSWERFSLPDAGIICERWAVVLVGLVAEPSDTVKQLAEMPDWCVLVVARDKGGEFVFSLLFHFE